jgi:hypothetical protein
MLKLTMSLVQESIVNHRSSTLQIRGIKETLAFAIKTGLSSRTLKGNLLKSHHPFDARNTPFLTTTTYIKMTSYMKVMSYLKVFSCIKVTSCMEVMSYMEVTS